MYNRQSIFADLLLKPAIRGFIEDPGYYFDRQNPDRLLHLDLLLLTQGYRRFVWKDILVGKEQALPFAAEPITQTIRGILLNLKGKPVPKGKVTLFSAETGVILDTLTDEKGHFVFDQLLLAGNTRFTLQGKDAKGSDQVELAIDSLWQGDQQAILLDTVPHPLDATDSVWIKPYLHYRAQVLDSLIKRGVIGVPKALETVEVTAKQEKKSTYNLNPSGRADQTIDATELEGCPILSGCLPGRLRGVIFKNKRIEIMKDVFQEVPYPHTTRGGDAMLLVMDGRNLDLEYNGDEIFDLLMTASPSDFESVEVLRDPALTAVYGATGKGGVILFHSKRFSDRHVAEQFNVKNIVLHGFTKVREFYMPNSSDKPMPAMPDRATVYWNPDVVTDRSGKAPFQFPLPSKSGKYRMVIEGVGVSGKLGRAMWRLVEKKETKDN